MKEINTRIDFFKERPGMVIAELGVFKGDFSRELLTCEPDTLVLVDIWQGAMSSGDKDGLNRVDVADMGALYLDILKEFELKALIVRERSTDFLSRIEDNSLDCVYIDSTHEFEQTRDELNLSRDKVKPGGWITGHDYNVGGVGDAVDSFCQLNGLEIEFIAMDGQQSFYIKNIK